MKTGREAVDQDRRRFLGTAPAGMAAVGASSLLPSQPAAAPAGEGVRPFRFEASEEQLDDLRRRTAATKWPDKEQVPDTTQGVQLATMQALAQHWAKNYDWRKVEAQPNARPNFITEIECLDIHIDPLRASA